MTGIALVGRKALYDPRLAEVHSVQPGIHDLMLTIGAVFKLLAGKKLWG